MSRYITGLEIQLAHDLFKEAPHLGIIELHIADGLCSIELDSAVIIKSYDDALVLILGDKKLILSDKEFGKVVIQ